jgi:hypothetical protein
MLFLKYFFGPVAEVGKAYDSTPGIFAFDHTL